MSEKLEVKSELAASPKPVTIGRPQTPCILGKDYPALIHDPAIADFCVFTVLRSLLWQKVELAVRHKEISGCTGRGICNCRRLGSDTVPGGV